MFFGTIFFSEKIIDFSTKKKSFFHQKIAFIFKSKSWILFFFAKNQFLIREGTFLVKKVNYQFFD